VVRSTNETKGFERSFFQKKTPIQPSINRRRRRRRSIDADRSTIDLFTSSFTVTIAGSKLGSVSCKERSRRSTPDGRWKMSRCEIRRHAPDQLAQKDFLVRVERLRIESNKIFVSHLPSALVAFHVARSPRRASFPRPDRRRLHASIQSFDRFAPKKTHREKRRRRAARERATSRPRVRIVTNIYVR
jgi:hypothetical protein